MTEPRTLEMPAVRTPHRSSPNRPPPKRSVAGRLVSWLLVLVLLLLVGLVSAAVYASAAIPRVEVPSLDAGGASPTNYLVVGSDSRDQIIEGYEPFFAGGGGERSDTIMLLHFVGGRAQLLSLPRDLQVEIPGRGVDKINAAYAYGGPDLLVQTVKQATGLAVHRYLEVSFVGLAEMVNAMGGVDLAFPHAARDDKSGLDVEAGTTTVDGATAVAYARSRSYLEYRGGEWVSVEADDIGRTHRQQRLILSMLGELKEPATLPHLPAVAAATGDALTAGPRLSFVDLLSVGVRVPFLSSEDIEAATLPVVPSNQGGVSYVVPVEPEATRVLEAFRSGASLMVAAEGLPTVRVLNGNGVQGAAGRAAGRLETEGFTVTGVGDAERNDYQTTLIIARPERLERARLVADRLGFGRVQAGEPGGDAEVLVILGLDQP